MNTSGSNGHFTELVGGTSAEYAYVGVTMSQKYTGDDDSSVVKEDTLGVRQNTEESKGHGNSVVKGHGNDGV